MPKSMPAFVEGRDYYVEQGLYVFTAEFLRRRGFCCGNGCRHCPYAATNIDPIVAATTPVCVDQSPSN